MFFIYLIISMLSFSTKQVIWEDTLIKIPVGDSLSMYVDLPKATLYINGIKVINPEVYYEKDGVERTFISTVNTQIVKDYEIKYRVTFPQHNVTYTETITFSVVDTLPPVITKIPTFSMPLGAKIPDVMAGLLYHDNYDRVEDIEVIIDLNHVIINRVGIYPIYYRLKDRSNNTTTGQTTLEIYDHKPPEITQKKPLVLNYRQTWVWQDFFTIKDDVDTDILVEIKDHLVNYNQLGTYLLTIKATDQSNLSTTLTTDLIIIDTVKPFIRLTTKPKSLTIFEPITKEMLYAYVIEISDNYDILTHDDLHITHDIDIDRLGEYVIYYQISDTSGNLTSAQIKVKVVDDIKPEIHQREPLILNVFTSNPNLISYFDLSDNYDTFYEMTFMFKGTYNLNKIGIYPITLEVTDQAKNKTIFMTQIMVVDRIAPTITLKSDILITDYQPKDLKHYFDVYDNYDKKEDITIEIDDTQVNYHLIGLYKVKACAKDTSDNLTCDDFEVMVIDVTPPLLTLKTHYVTIDISVSFFDAAAYIEHYEDDYQKLTSKDIIITHNIQFQMIGRYEVIYTLHDQSYNTTSHTLYVTIDATKPLTIQAPKLVYQQYSAIDFMKDLTMDEHPLAHQVIFDTTHVNYRIPGCYQVAYIITDERGRSYLIYRDVWIQPIDEKKSAVAYLPMIGANLILGAVLYLFHRRSL